jgi:3-hydroxyisobutyrate dehydrogenase-like beta-hydroxyacid dehydrogenase
MAANVLRAGFELVVFDVRPEACLELASAGAVIATGPTELGARCDVVMVNVVNDQQVCDVLLGPDGVMAAARAGAVVVVHSTIHPRTCRRLADEAGRHGLGYLDAAFSGGAAAAQAGTLTLMVGGDAGDLERSSAVLAAVSGRVFHVGGPGMGEVAKLTNNALLSVVLQATSEALGLSRRSGIDDDLMLAILCESAGASWVTRNWNAIAETTRTYPGGVKGMADLIHKDVTLALDVAYEVRARLPTVALVSQMLEQPYHRPGDPSPAP